MRFVEGLQIQVEKFTVNLNHFRPKLSGTSLSLLAAVGIIAVLTPFLDPKDPVLTGVPENAILKDLTVGPNGAITRLEPFLKARVIGRLKAESSISTAMLYVNQGRWYQILKRRNDSLISKGFVPADKISPKNIHAPSSH